MRKNDLLSTQLWGPRHDRYTPHRNYIRVSSWRIREKYGELGLFTELGMVLQVQLSKDGPHLLVPFLSTLTCKRTCRKAHRYALN
jgi:hypothetical protein